MFQVKHHEELVGSSESFFIALLIRMRKIECPLPDPAIKDAWDKPETLMFEVRDKIPDSKNEYKAK